MSAYDSFSDSKILGGFAANGAAKVITGSEVGPAMDTRGFASVLFVFQITRSAGVYALYLQHSDDGTNFVDVPVADLLGVDPDVLEVGVDGLIVDSLTVSSFGRFSTTSTKRYFRFSTNAISAPSLLCSGGGIGFASSTQPVAAQTTGT